MFVRSFRQTFLKLGYIRPTIFQTCSHVIFRSFKWLLFRPSKVVHPTYVCHLHIDPSGSTVNYISTCCRRSEESQDLSTVGRNCRRTEATLSFILVDPHLFAEPGSRSQNVPNLDSKALIFSLTRCIRTLIPDNKTIHNEPTIY